MNPCVTSEPSDYIKSIEDERIKLHSFFTRLSDITAHCMALEGEDLPPIAAMNNVGSDTAEHFKSIMIDIFSELYKRFKLTPQSSVLDLGCGCGRFTFPFAQLLSDSGNYWGADVWSEGIDICNRAHGRQNVSFHLLPAANNYYYDDFDGEKKNEFKLDFLPDESLDLAFGISVFSHLIEEDARAYLKEFRRVLKSAGCAYITCFVIDKFFYDYVERTGNHALVKQKSPGFFQAYEGQDFFGAFTLNKWREMTADYDLEIISIERGTWADKPSGRNYQDVLVLMPNHDVDNL